MIIISGRDFTLSEADKQIGFIGDNEVEVRQFKITDPNLFNFNFKLDLQTKSGAKGIVDLVKTTEVDGIVLTWEILEEHITENGLLTVQIRAFDNDNIEKWHSSTNYFVIGNSINASSTFPSPLPSEFTTMEANVTSAKNETLSAKDLVLTKADEISANAQSVSDNTNLVTQKSGEVQTNAINAKTSETNAAESAVIAGNNILNGVTTHNEDAAAHPTILSDLTRVEAIARGKANALNFETVSQLDAWIAGTYIRPDGKTTADLNIGDNLYIVDVAVPDYWWDGTQKQELEAEAVNLTDYYNKVEVDNRLPITIEQSDYDALVAKGTVIAGRIYYIVPDGTLGG